MVKTTEAFLGQAKLQFMEQYGNCQFDATEKIMEINSTGKTSSPTLAQVKSLKSSHK